MRSQTQRDLTAEQAVELVRGSLGPDVDAVSASELGGGGFAAVWRVELKAGPAVVLKTSPPADAVLLTYERGLLAAEVACFRRLHREAPTIPAPVVLHHGTHGQGTWFDGEWMVMSLLPGRPLTEYSGLDPAVVAPVRREMGSALAAMHALTAAEFGYTGPGRTAGGSWRSVFLSVVEDLLADASRLGSDLPIPAGDVERAFRRRSACLDDVSVPALVQFDPWDGNVLVERTGDGGLRMSGLVDGERCLYGDPLVDFVAADLMGRIEEQPEHPFLHGYAHSSGRELVWGTSELYRIRLYRAWMYLVMNVEIPTRGMLGDHAAERRRKRSALLHGALQALL